MNSFKKYISKELESQKIKGLNKNSLLNISKLRNEPQSILKKRIQAFEYWQTMKQPKLSFDVNINFEEVYPYSFPDKNKHNEKVIQETFNHVGINSDEQQRISKIAVDAVFDSESVFTTYQDELAQKGIIFCSMKEAAAKYPELINKYMGTVVPYHDNFYACLNRAFFSDGTFVYIPPKVKCPMPISSYFKIDSLLVSQMEYTLIIADEESSVTYLEGCSAPFNKKNQLHNAIVEIVVLNKAQVRYFTLQNWYTGDENGVGGVLNLVTKRALVHQDGIMEWFQIETGAIYTCKYPSCILKGDNAIGSFFSLTYSDKHMVVDSGTNMIHLGKNTKSTIVSKSIINDKSTNIFRSKIDMQSSNCISSSQCDTLLLSDKAKSYTYPRFFKQESTSIINHEASTFLLDENLIFYFQLKGIKEEEAKEIIIKGFSSFMLDVLPDEFLFEMEGLIHVRFNNKI